LIRTGEAQWAGSDRWLRCPRYTLNHFAGSLDFRHGETSMSNKKEISRRNFLTTAAAGGAALTIVPRNVLGRGFTPPSDTLNIAAVGVGGMGRTNVINLSSQNIVALCDVD